MSCERVIEVEDLVLGLAQSDEAADLEVHVASCVDCRDAREMFLAERALFEVRETHIAAAVPVPPLALPKPAIARVYRFVPAIAAFAACIAIFIGRAHVDDCDEPAPAAAASIKLASMEEAPRSTASIGIGVCRAPLSESFAQSSPAPAVSIASLSSRDEATCVPSPNATCDVTSDVATP